MMFFNLINISVLLLIGHASGAEVRLVGGRTPYEGRLEVRESKEDPWGTACDDNFDQNDARVVCRMLGFHNTDSSSVVEPEKYGPGSGKILLDEIGCTGNESDVLHCSVERESNCAHTEDVGVSCQTPARLVGGSTSHSGRIEIQRNGAWKSICFDTFSESAGKVICRMLALSTGNIEIKPDDSSGNISTKTPTCDGDEKDITMCQMLEGSCNSGKSASIDCRTQIWLQGGPNPQLGRVEVYFQDKKGTVCDDSFDDNAASVICRMLGYNPKGARARGRAFYGRGSGPVIIDELRCSGDETDISECKSNVWGSHTNCDHDEDASVECGTEIRLVDGPTRFSGRLEIKSKTSWNTMCDGSLSNKTALVICRMLGFERGNISIHAHSYYGASVGKMTNYSLECLGNETDIVNCKHISSSSCNHGDSVGVNCYSVTPVRLQGGPTRYSGRVEVYMQELSTWMGICDASYGFTVNDAKVLCRMIGKPNMNPSFHTATNLYDYVIRGKAISKMNCSGSERDITDCRSGQKWLETICDYPDYVGINCEPVTKVRLLDGPSARAGRVEVQYNGTWGTVCKDNFDSMDSDVICNMLGYSQKSFLLNSDEYEQSNISKIITNAQCKGSEQDISDCRADPWTSGSCPTGFDVGIACNSTVRLVNGTSERSGRVEIYHEEKWWTMCSDDVDENVADVVCRMAGFRFWNASILRGSPFGKGTGNVLINDISCNGSEPDLAACTSSPWKNTTCVKGHVATVDCKIRHTPIRLVKGDTIYSGIVQVFHNNRWGTICYSTFSKRNAEIICWSLGYNFTSDISYSYNKYGRESNNVMISNMKCIGNETDISVCPSDDWDTGSENCSYSTSYHSVNIDCLTPIRLTAGRTEAMGRVEVQHNNYWGTVCKDDFVEKNIPVICSMLGFNYTKNFVMMHNSFHSSNVPNTLIQNLECSGSEIDLQQCKSSLWQQTSNCSSSNTASVSCNTPVRLSEGKDWRTGRAELFYNSQWTDICYENNSLSSRTSKVICRMMGLSTGKLKTYSKNGQSSNAAYFICDGSEKDISRCNITIDICPRSSRLAIKCETAIKLERGRTAYMGGVSLHLNNRWETILYINNDQAADVICQMLGYNFTRYHTVQTRKELRSYSSCRYTTLERLNCDGNETDIFDCQNSYWNYDNSHGCYDFYSGVNCQTPIRLTSGLDYQFGKLEVKENDTWHQVCSTNFSLQNAYVVCRMLGHKHVRNTTVLLESITKQHGKFVSGDLHCNGNEEDISECPKRWVETTCINGGIVSLDCRSTIRLVDGPTKYRGRVEILYEGKWGQICNRGTSANAKVMCRMLGYNYAGATVHSGRSYGHTLTNNDTFTITNLRCVGTEDDITECPADDWENGTTCYSNTPLEIECNTPVSLQSGSNSNIGYVYVNYNSTVRTVCGDNFTENEADVICRKIDTETNQNATIYYGNKFGGPSYTPISPLKCSGDETDLQECSSLPWYITSTHCNSSNTVVSVNCRPHTPIRLNGSDHAGLVEINYRNVWGTICYNNFDIKDASVLCNMLGFKIGTVGSPVYTAQYDAITTGLQCDGMETDVSECGSTPYSWSTRRICYDSSYNRDDQRKATVECSNDRVRLVNGVNDYQGRIEFQFIGIWGTICDENFDLLDAEVICRQIGFNSEKRATLYNSTWFGQSHSSLVIDDLQCSGTEKDLDECSSFPWSASSYICALGHRTAGVNCRPHTPVRLVNTTSQYFGRVEIEYKGSNGTICDRGFDENDAKVICRMLGFNTLSTAVKKHAYFGQGSGNIFISDLHCNGDEQDISECRTDYNYRWGSPYEYCTHGHDVSVQCNTPVRLRGGWTYYDGSVEIYINGSWKSVCYDGFTEKDAQTICKLTGLSEDTNRSQNVTVFKGSYFGMKGTPTIRDLGCNGNVEDLYSCGSSKWTTQLTSCEAHDIAAINCRPLTQVRLMNNGTRVTIPSNRKHSITGRVEIRYTSNDQWGTICDDQFDESDALVLCNMMGIPFGKVYRHSDTSVDYVDVPATSKTSIFIDDLNCLGIEKDISACRAREWGTHNCEHSEDVAITCYYKTIDPCSAEETARLPSLEMRYVNIDTTLLPKPINDSKLPFRWYNVGNNTMPVKIPPEDKCGTHLPIYSTYATERLGANKTAVIKATQVGNKNEIYDIEMKNCNDEYYVYKLRPTTNEESGYCFGIGSKEPAPTFLPDSLSTTTVTDEKGVSFMCKFNPSTNEDLYYQVKWRIQGNSQKTLTKQFFKKSSMDSLRLTESDFEKNDISLGVNITCAVLAFRTPEGQPGPLSAYSKPLFFGIKVLTPAMTLRTGETKTIELINSVPIICYTGNKMVDQFIQRSCDIRLQYFSPQYGTCSSMPTFHEGCDRILTNDEVGQIVRINISAAETGQYGVSGHFKIFLSVPAKELGYLKLWRKTYKLPMISVDVLPETHTEWRGSVCTARNDPHMYTFDQKPYEHHENGGEYILYRHKFYTNVEIQHKVAPCTDGNDIAKCNCGVAVRAGRDVYVINVCDNLLDIGHKHCGDEALTVKKDNDFTYTIYLPFGTAVRARIDNQPYMGKEGGKVLDISILPSVHDKDGNSTGLCGTLNNNQEDDFQHRNEGIGTIDDRITFIKSWKVLQNESLFSANVEKMYLEPWVFPMCTCKQDPKESPLSCDRSVSACTPGIQTGQHSCDQVSSRRSVRSLVKRPRIPLVRQTRHYQAQHKIIKRESGPELWTHSKAAKHCRDYFSALETFKLCKKVPSTHTNVSEQNCILDIMLTNSSEWVDISRQSMLDTCQSEIHRNASVRQELIEKAKNATAEAEANLHSGTTILPPTEIEEIEKLEETIKTIKEISCLNDCSGNGNCSNGTCKCKQGFGASDCSLDINKPPRLQEILDNGHCDEQFADCTHIYVFGEVFVGTNLTCRLKRFTMAVNYSRVTSQTYHTKGKAETLVEAMCPIEHLSRSRRRRSDDNKPPSDFVHGYEVSVSNDGNNFGNKTLDVFVYNSKCQSYNNGSIGITFDLKNGYCHIEGKCVKNGTLSMQQTMICDPRMAKFRWTTVPTTTQTPSTTAKTSPTAAITDCVCNVNNTDSCIGNACNCKTGWTGSTCGEDIDECNTDTTVCDNEANSGCQNTLGRYSCLCLRHFRISEKGVCEDYPEKNPNTTIAEIENSEPGQKSFTVEMTIDFTVSNLDNLNVTETYQKYLHETKSALKQYYQQKLGIGLKDVVIISLRLGSLIVQHAVVVKSEEYVIKSLSVAIADLSLGEKIKLFGQPYSAYNVKVEDTNVGVETDHFLKFLLCESYTKLHPCRKHESCVVEKGTATCKSQRNDDNSVEGNTNLIIIISSTVGGVLVIVIFALLVVICCKRKKTKNRLENHTHDGVQNEYNDMTGREMVSMHKFRHYSDGKGKETANDNPSFKRDSRDSLTADTALDSRLTPVYSEGSYRESPDGYVYYFGKKRDDF